jgi:hypothetical protein
MNKKILFSLLLLLLLFFNIYNIRAQEQPVQKKINPILLSEPWKAQWITHPQVHPKAYSVIHFRKVLDLTAKPEDYIVHISGDNRFMLFINGNHVFEGPARGDLLHWRFETIDLSSYLQIGPNTIAVVVWNFGEHKALSQISNQTAFIMQGNTENESVVNTDDTWKVIQNKAYEPIPFGPVAFHGYYVVGPGELIHGSQYIWDWEKPDFDDKDWGAAALLGRGTPRGNNSHENWQMVQNQLPPMENIPQRFQRIRRTSGFKVPEQFLQGKAPVQIPPNSKTTILLDNGVNTTSFPELNISGGEGATIKLTYGEAMFDDKKQKGHRDEVEGRHIFGKTGNTAHFIIEHSGIWRWR